MAKPKLALIPATQGSKLYSVLPADGVGDFNFSRNTGATRINKDGLIETVAVGKSRLNYPLIDGVVNGCPSHLLEPQSINILNYSEDFSQSYWTKSGSSIISNQVISPDGTLNADKLVEGTNNGVHKIVKPYTGISGTNTCSIFVKPNGVTKIGITSTESVGVLSSFDLSNGTLISSSSDDYSITPFPNGWFRISSTDIGGNRKMAVFLLDDTGNYSYQGDGTSELYVWGAMLEQSSFPTSYIKSNSGSSVTRSAETANGAGDASTFNDSEGVLMAEISGFSNTDSSPRVFSLSDGGGSNRVICFISNTEFVANIQKLGQTAIDLRTDLGDVKSSIKASVKYKENDFSLYINGFKVASSSSGQTYSVGTLDRINFDSGYGIENFYGSTKQIQYFDSALNDSDLETITSWTSFTDLANGQQYSIK